MKKILRGPSKYRIRCNNCDCEFEYQRDDLIYMTDVGKRYVKCINCDSILPHSESFSSCTSAECGNIDTMTL